MSRTFETAVAGWAVAFGALLRYWLGMEALEPGRQYADPFIPCAFLAVGGACLALGVRALLRWAANR